MKKSAYLAIILILCAALLFGCGKKEAAPAETQSGTEASEAAPATDQKDYEGLYTYLGFYAKGQFVVDQEMIPWSVNLKKDGAGTLYWGENNNGPISSWVVEDGKITINAGVSVIEGTIEDHIMLLDMGDGYTIGWAGPGTDFYSLELITMEDFIRENQPEDASAVEYSTPAELVGAYYPFACERDGYCVAMPVGITDGVITLYEDGRATMPTGGVMNEFQWGLCEDGFRLYDDTGEIMGYEGTVADGIMTIEVIYDLPDGSQIIGYNIFAREDADTSGIETISIEEYNAAMSAKG